ncbi:MAG: hypothetical protein HIU82_01380 [Proteobacteria bacterium]|nr:hypothetical protein [Pseudomonadota bacterium]
MRPPRDPSAGLLALLGMALGLALLLIPLLWVRALGLAAYIAKRLG